MNKRILAAAGLFMPALSCLATSLDAVNADKQPLNWIAVAMFVGFVLLTFVITKVAAAKTRSASDFYTGGGGITGFQNGLAIAGDYMSAAAFLGISAAVYVNGYDGLLYSIGFLVGWPILTFLMAERLRNLGRYTFSDVAAFRFEQTSVRTFAAVATLVIVAFYLIAQMVGAGQLIKLLFGLDYKLAVVIVGSLMVVYVMFGGMAATTWVQIIKAVMLLSGVTFMAFMVMAKFSFNPEAMFATAVEVHARKDAIMRPGGFINDPVSAVSFGMALMFGTAGLPHILMRFFTVPSASEARKSVFWATTWLTYFCVLTFVIGFGAVIFVSTNPEFRDAGGALLGGPNMAAIHLAKELGGSVFLGFISAVTFATILAVVAGLTLSGASAVSHDLFATVLHKGKASSRSELLVSRGTTLLLGLLAMALGIAFEKQNIAFMVSLAFSIAASATFPVLFSAVLWKGCTTRGATAGGFVGLISSVSLTIGSKPLWVDILGMQKAWFPYSSPALFSMCAAFATIIVVSRLDRSPRSFIDRTGFMAQAIRSETGIGAARAAQH